MIRLNYARCHHPSLEFLEKRCHNSLSFSHIEGNQEDDFYIKNDSVKLAFYRNANDSTYAVYDSLYPAELLLELTNDHLLGLNDPTQLFKVVKNIKNLWNLTQKRFSIVKNKIFLFESNFNNASFKEAFEKVVLIFDQFIFFSVSKNFKIQLGLDNCLVFNRRLKISFLTLATLLKNDGQKVVEILVELAHCYFKCFSIAPVCCRMQSIAPEATIFDFEKYTYMHIQRYSSLYLKLCKILYPFVVDIDEELLKRKYLEVIPVTLIQRFHGVKLEEFIQKLKSIIAAGISVIPLSNGNFRIGDYLNFTADMLCKIDSVQKLKDVVKELNEIVTQYSLKIWRQEDFEINSQNKNVEFNSVIFSSAKEVENFPICRECQNDVNKTLCILRFEHFEIIAFEKINEDIFMNEFCQNFSNIFKPPPYSLFFPIRQTYLKGHKGEKITQRKKDISKILPNFNLLVPYSDDKHFFCYSGRFVFENTDKMELALQISKDLRSFEESEGICLTFAKNRIDTIENLETLTGEFDPEYYKSTADYCFYNEDDLLKFFEKAKNETNIFSSFMFEITQHGLIRFMDRIEISPSTFMIVKNSAKLLRIIKKLCFLDRLRTCQVQIWLKDPKDNKTWLIGIAKALNPRLEKLSDSCFDLQNFWCIPYPLLKKLEKTDTLQRLLSLRNSNIKIKASKNFAEVLLDRCCFKVDILSQSFNVDTLLILLDRIENINAKMDDFLLITHDPYFRILDYESLESQTCNQNIPSFENVKKCFEFFQNNPVMKDVVVVRNKSIFINRAFGIQINDIMRIDSTIYETFFELINLLLELNKQIYRFFPDNMISLSADDKITEILRENEKFSFFKIVDDKKETYLKVAVLCNGILETISEDEKMKVVLYSDWLKLIPREMLMATKYATKLLEILNYIKEMKFNNKESYRIVGLNGGSIGVENVQLPISKWLQIYNIDELDKFLEICIKFSGEFQPKLGTQVLHENGLFSVDGEKREKFVDNENLFEPVVKQILDIVKENQQILSITLNSGTNILLGNFIWFDVEEITVQVDKVLKMVYQFERVWNTEDKDLMRNIIELIVKSEQEKMKAIEMVKIINPNLKGFTDEDICNEHLRIIPTDLWEKCYSDSNTYQKTINLFQMLKKYEISWLIQLNGNISLHERIIVTFTDLLHFYDTKETSDNLKILVTQSLMDEGFYLICKEEIEQNKESQIFMTQISSYKAIIEKNKKLKTQKMFHDSRIEPNGTLIINSHIWIKADDPLISTIPIVTKLVKEIFPNNKFQFGHVETSVLTSLLEEPAHRLYQYCCGMCKLVQEAYEGIVIKYLPENDMFNFNDVLSIHPRSFFHLQDIDNVVEVLKKFSTFKKTWDTENEMTEEQILKKNIEEAEICKMLGYIKKEERLEFEEIKERFFKYLGTILWNHRKGRLASINEIKEMQENTDVKTIPIQDEHIFNDGSTLGFINFDQITGKIKFEYNDEHIVGAIELALKLDETFKCKNLFDFQSVVEIVRAYPKFKQYQNEKIPVEVQQMLENEQIMWWLLQVQEQQEKERKYKFSNCLKGLHHWLKHPHGFENLEDYYNKMNDFFDTADYGLELDAQNGEFFSRHYRNENYIGFYALAHDDSAKTNYVASFWKEKEKKNPLKFVIKKEKEVAATALLITDTNFSTFKSKTEICLNEKIVVKFISPPIFSTLNNIIAREIDGIKTLMLFLPKTTGKGDFSAKSFQESVTKIGKKPVNAKIILCYSNKANPEQLQILLENPQINLEKIDESLLTKKDASELQTFVESILQL